MNIDLNSLIAILMIFILTLFSILLFHVGRHTKSNVYLLIYFISQIVGIAYLAFFPYGKGYYISLLSAASISVVIMWGPLFYLFISSLLFPHFRFSLKTLLHFIPAVLVFIYILLTRRIMFLKSILIFKTSIFVFVFNVLIVVYNIAAFYNYSIYRKQRKNLLVYKLVPEKWIKIALFGFAISCFINETCNQFGNYLGLSIIALKITINITFLLFFCVLFYVSITNKILIKQSEIIEKYKNQNFSEYINFCRVQYAMDLLKHPVNKEKTMFSILIDSGFNSKTAFNTTFKKIANCTPIEFKKKMLNV